MCDHCGCHAFPAIAELSAEHDRILTMAWDLAERTRRGERSDHESDGPLLDLLTLHVAKEETGLYPILRGIGSLADDASDLLEREHRDLHAALTEGGFDRRDYYALAAHIEQEEMALFPEAMFGFDDESWDALDAAHRAVDPPRAGLVDG